MQITDTTVKTVAQQLMRAVVKSGALDDHDGALLDRAVEIMRQELKDVLFAPSYARVREIVADSKAPDADVLAVAFGIMVANCITKIRNR